MHLQVIIDHYSIHWFGMASESAYKAVAVDNDRRSWRCFWMASCSWCSAEMVNQWALAFQIAEEWLAEASLGGSTTRRLGICFATRDAKLKMVALYMKLEPPKILNGEIELEHSQTDINRHFQWPIQCDVPFVFFWITRWCIVPVAFRLHGARVVAVLEIWWRLLCYFASWLQVHHDFLSKARKS